MTPKTPSSGFFAPQTSRSNPTIPTSRANGLRSRTTTITIYPPVSIDTYSRHRIHSGAAGIALPPRSFYLTGLIRHRLLTCAARLGVTERSVIPKPSRDRKRAVCDEADRVRKRWRAHGTTPGASRNWGKPGETAYSFLIKNLHPQTGDRGSRRDRRSAETAPAPRQGLFDSDATLSKGVGRQWPRVAGAADRKPRHERLNGYSAKQTQGWAQNERILIPHMKARH